MNLLRKLTAYRVIIPIIFLVVHVILFGVYGTRPLEDAERYVEAGKLFLVRGQIDSHFHFFYLVPIALLAGFTRLAGDPRLFFILFQSVLSAGAVWALFRTTRVLQTQRTAIIAALMYVLWIENIRWNLMTMTESLFGSLVVFVLCLLALYQRTLRFNLLILLLLLVALFTRPTGLLLFIAFGAFLIHANIRQLESSRLVAIMVSVVVLGLLILGAIALSQTWDFTHQYFRGNVITYADSYSGSKSLLQVDPAYVYPGNSGDSPIEKTLHFISSRPLHVLQVSVMKLLYLLTGIRPYYSVIHNVLTLAWAILVYIGAVRGIRIMPGSPLKTSLITLIVANTVLVCASTVDWDNRFYIPMEAAVVVFSAIGWDAVLNYRAAGEGTPEV